jgi:hypothetical protein
MHTDRVITLPLLILIIFVSVTFFNSSQLSLAQTSSSTSSQTTTSYVNSFTKLVKDAHDLTQSYQNEFGKWKTHQYDNKTMISIINNYLPKYENLVNESKMLQLNQYQNASDLYTKSLASELQSYVHFRNYLLTNNSTENKLSSKFLSDAFKYEVDSFKVLNSSGLFTVVP